MGRYIPTTSDTPEQRAEKAHRCGLELSPSDTRSGWIDALTGSEYRDLCAQYAEGQSEQYEQEEW